MCRPAARSAAALGFAFLLVLPLAPVAAAEAPLGELFAAPVPTVAADLNVTAVLAGIGLTPAEESSLLSQINRTWWPIITSMAVPLGVNYSVRVRLVNASDNFTRAYAGALGASFSNDSIGSVVGNYLGLLENLSRFSPTATNFTPVRHANAQDAVAWLSSAERDFPEVAAPEGEARFFFLNPYAVSEPYYYIVRSTDRDRGSTFQYETINAWGDGAGVFFQDLRAAPSHLGEGASSGRPANFAGQPPLWSYGSSPGERARLVEDLARYLDMSLRMLVAPSFVVAPFDAISLTLNVTLIDATAAQSLFQPGGVGASHGIDAVQDILNASLVAAALHDLVPFSAVSVRLAVVNQSTDPQGGAALAAHTSSAGGSSVLDPFGLHDDLKARWGVPSLPIEPGESVSVPALLVVRDGETWVDGLNIRGATLQRSDGRAAGIIIAAGLAQLAQRGFSETLVHEGGHALGLGHPHELGRLAPNGTTAFDVDWLRTSSSTPMTYLPNYVDYSFDSFDRHALWTGVAAATLGAAFQLRQAAYARLEALGYDAANLPAHVLENETLFLGYANQTRNLLARGILYIEALAPYSSGGAIVMAKRAYDQARDLTVLSILQPRCCGTPRPGFLPGPDPLMAAAALTSVAVAVAAVAGRRR